MPIIRKTQLPPPESDEDFEDLCLDIAKELWQDPEAYKIGSQGQNQHGVDVCAANALRKNLVYGIQAKKKKELTKQKLTKKNINDTLEKAENFEPHLDKIVIASTSSRDAKLQPFIVNKQRERREKLLFPFEVWFWKDIEEILRQKCHSTYLDYLTSILPESAIDHLSKDIIKEALIVAEEFARSNYVEKAEGVITAFKGVINRSTDPEIKLLAKRIEIQILLRKERKDEAIELIKELNKEYPNDLDILWLLYDRAIEDEDFNESENIIETIKEIDSTDPVSKITDLVHKLHTGKEIEICDDEPPGRNDREKSLTYLVYHLYAHKVGNKELREIYLRKYEELLPNSPKPICYRIIYSVQDLVADLENLTLEKIEKVFESTACYQEEIKKRDPISISDEINIILELLRLHVLILHRYAPKHQIPFDLRKLAISKLCQSYYDPHNAHNITRLLSLILLDKNELDTIIKYFKKAGRPLNRTTAYLVISQGLFHDTTLIYAENITMELSLDEQKDFIEGVKNENLPTVLTNLDGLSGQCLFSVISTIPNKQFALSIIDKVLPKITDEETRATLIEKKIYITIAQGGEDVARKINEDINIREEGFHMSVRIAHFASSHQLWDLEATALNRALEFTIPDEDRVYIKAQLITALFNMQDHKGVLEHKDYMLDNIDKLSSDNQIVVLRVMILSFLRRDDSKQALEVITNNFNLLQENFEFSCLKAHTEIDLGEYKSALSSILEGLRSQHTVTREMFLSCHNLFVEIANAENIINEKENVVRDNTYVKLSDIGTWFYIGDKKPIDAVQLDTTDNKYTAIFGKALGHVIEWPPDKYSHSSKKRIIESILTEPAYVGVRATESLMQIAEEGTADIHTLNIGEKGDFESIISFWKEKEKDKNALFEIYKNNRLPFAFLVHIEGSIGRAIAKLQIEQEGFIYINDGTGPIIDTQIQLASTLINGSPAFIDATSLLLLIETGLIENVCTNIANLYYTPSVVNYIREHASHFAPSPYQLGRLAFSNTYEPIYIPYDYQQETNIKSEILKAIENFENHAKKETEKYLSSKESEIEKKFAAYIIDPHVAARVRKYPIITEDYFCSQSMKFFTKEEQPQPISSMALMEILYQNNLLRWNDYLNFIDHLLTNRCYLVPISAKLIFQAVFGDKISGLYIFQPNNIKKLHLELTLSEQYGVSPKRAISIMSEFIEMIINDNTIDLSTYKTLLSQFLTEVSKGRDYSFGNTLLLACQQRLKNQSVLIHSPLRDKKQEILRTQIEIYFSDYSTLILPP